MPWMSIFVWLITFLISSSKEGVSTGKAALIASGAAAGAYLLADPSNSTNYLGVTTTTPAATSATSLAPTQTSTGVPIDWGKIADTTVKTAGNVITSPATAGTILAAGATTGSGAFAGMSTTTLLLLGAGALLLFKN